MGLQPATRKICVVTGSRADYGLLYFLMREILLNPRYELQVVVTGMHQANRPAVFTGKEGSCAQIGTKCVFPMPLSFVGHKNPLSHKGLSKAHAQKEKGPLPAHACTNLTKSVYLPVRPLQRLYIRGVLHGTE